jgi:uncharacterized protein GlcG (DUF336 family)
MAPGLSPYVRGFLLVDRLNSRNHPHSFAGEMTMTLLTLAKAQTVLMAALAYARERSFAPMTVVILDARGVLKVFGAEDDTPLRRAGIAIGKAYGALAMGAGSRSLEKRAEKQPYFIAAATHAVGGALIPVPGGVLIRGEDKEIIGAVGVTGDASDNDEATGLAGLEAGLEADPS